MANKNSFWRARAILYSRVTEQKVWRLQGPLKHQEALERTKESQSYALTPVYSQGDVPTSLLPGALASESSLGSCPPCVRSWPLMSQRKDTFQHWLNLCQTAQCKKLCVNIALVNLLVAPMSQPSQTHKDMVYDQLYAWVCLCMCAEREARGRHQNVIFYHSLPYFPETKSLTEPGAKLATRNPPAPVPSTELGLRACEKTYSVLFCFVL